MWKNIIIKDKLKEWGIDWIFIIAGCALGAFSSICIMIPNGLTSGGITGLCRILQETTGINFSILYYCCAFLILVICGILLGIGEARKILLLTILYPGFLFLFEQFDITLLEEKDVILAAIYCGVFAGASTGLIFTRGYSFGGTDTIAKIIKKKLLPQMGISKILLVIDAVIIIASGLTNVYLLKNADHTRKGPSKIPMGDANAIPSTTMPTPNITAAIRVDSLLFRSFNTLNSFISIIHSTV
jgi:uncharacterized membrane-anchored protein YitT (DUF2179 family)